MATLKSSYRPGQWREPKRSGGLARFLLFLVVLLAIGGGIWLIGRGCGDGGQPDSRQRAEVLVQRVETTAAEWVRANGELEDARRRGAAVVELEARLRDAAAAWQQAEFDMFEEIQACRTAWRDVAANAAKARAEGRSAELFDAEMNRLAAALATMGTTPEEPKPVSRFRRESENPNFGKPLDFRHAMREDLNFPGGNGRHATSSKAATTGILVDLSTRNVLWEKNSSTSVPIASMVKMMTILLAMESFDVHRDWTLETPVKITPIVNSVPRDGVIYLDTRETFPIGDLLMAIAIKSANDAAWQVAEFVGGGDAQGFVGAMNRRAKALGMTGTQFTSPCGLPERSQGDSVSTAADLVLLGEELLQYPKVIEYTTTKQVSIPRALPPGHIDLTSTNKLVNPRWPGVDGLKTGYIKASGFCVTVSCLRDGRRLVAVVTGYPTALERDRFCRELLDWGYKRAAELK